MRIDFRPIFYGGVFFDPEINIYYYISTGSPMQAPGANQNCARSLGGNGGLDTSGKIGKSFVWVVRVWRPVQPSPLPTTPQPRMAAPPHPSHRDVKYNCTQKTTSTCSFAFCNTSRRLPGLTPAAVVLQTPPPHPAAREGLDRVCHCPRRWLLTLQVQ